LCELVFVYGTLRQSEPNHAWLDGAELVAEQAYVHGRLWDTGRGYPAAVLCEPDPDRSNRIYGELYRIQPEMLRNLDELEDYRGPEGPNEYERVRQLVHTDQQTYTACIYVYPFPPDQGKLLESGDWKAETRLKMEPMLYFAYGSCMDRDRFRTDGVDHLFQHVLGRGVLPHYELKFARKAADGLGRADIVETRPQGSRVEGKLYSINREALDYLFKREGVAGKAYRPAFVNVEHNGSMLRDVITFTVVHKENREAQPPEEYAEEILRGASGVVSEEYYEMLQMKMRRGEGT
jgi:gamma-glutamylcyclotransferase (GGCT)/AIG2-like uncharacterized protein YtfP/cation transport regulator ChaC